MADDRERASGEIHELLPAGWRVTGTQRDDAAARWRVTAVSPNVGGRRGSH